MEIKKNMKIEEKEYPKNVQCFIKGILSDYERVVDLFPKLNNNADVLLIQETITQ